MQALVKKKRQWSQPWRNRESAVLEAISQDQIEAVRSRAHGMLNLLLSFIRVGGRLLWELLRIALVGRRLVRYHAPGKAEELNEFEHRRIANLF